MYGFKCPTKVFNLKVEGLNWIFWYSGVSYLPRSKVGHNIFIWRGELPCDILLFFTKEVPFWKVSFSHHFIILKIYRNFKILLFIGQHSNLCWLFIWLTRQEKENFKQGTSLPCEMPWYFAIFHAKNVFHLSRKLGWNIFQEAFLFLCTVPFL